MADKNEAMENLFKAIDIITQERLSNLGYDKTIKATIVDDSKAEQGEYQVSDGSSEFTAYSNEKYTKDTIVYVIIPQGDYDNTKLIVGKYTTREASYNYANPSEDFLDATHNLISDVGEASLLANDDSRKFYRVWSVDNVNYQGYNRLALKGNFRTWLSSLDVVSGTYGLILYVVSKETSYNGNDFERTYKFTLSSDDMYGNPFNFETYYLQEKVVDISDIPDIISMELIFYQNSDFCGPDKELVPYLNGTEKYPDNLFIESPYISLGYDISDVTSDEVILYTLDPLTYDATYEEETRKKTLNVRWVHIQDDGSIAAIDQEDELPSGVVVRWYKYILDRAVVDKIAGTFWKEIEEAQNLFTYSFVPDILLGTEKYKVIIEYPSRNSIYSSLEKTVIDNLKAVEISKDPDTGQNRTDRDIVKLAAKSYTDNKLLSFQEYKQIILKYNDEYKVKNKENYSQYDAVIEALDDIYQAQADVQLYKSEILEFTNESYDPVSAAIDLISGLEILTDVAGYNGSYLLYDESGMITNAAEAIRRRLLTASYHSLITGEEILDRAEKIVWYFPLEGSMIQSPLRGIEYTDTDAYTILTFEELASLELPCAYCRIERAIPQAVEGDPGEEVVKQTEQYFRIKDYYTQAAINNTIYCTVFKNNKEYKAAATLVFGTAGTNGTEATFRLELREVAQDAGNNIASEYQATALTLGNGNAVAVVPKIYDYNNEDITDSYFKTHSVTYAWESKNKENGLELDQPPKGSKDQAAIIRVKSGVDIKKCRFYILSASVHWDIVRYEYDKDGNVKIDEATGEPIIRTDKDGNIDSRDVQLKTFLPIPVRVDNTYTQVVGPTQIIYDRTGVNPVYYKKPFILYKDGIITDITWKGICQEYLDDKEKNSSILKFYPYVDANGNLTPTTMYLANGKPYAVEAVMGENIVWTQPILIIQNKYSSAMLNAWDGDFVINEDNGTIMGTMFGAGKKDTNNTFTGVLMGDIEAGAGFTLKTGNKNGIGIYGFHQGNQSFGFNSDGTAFIGKAGRGRIDMNGDKGTIQSGSFTKYQSGMQIDLDGNDKNSTSSALYAYGVGGSFELNTDEDNPLLEIRSGPEKEAGKLIHIGNEKNKDFYIQSWDYNGKDTGTRLDLETGKYLTYANNGSYIQIDPKGLPYFNIYDVGGQRNIFYASTSNFYLQSANYTPQQTGMYLNLRTGDIDARQGYIGGWKITNSTLEAGNITLRSEGSIYGGPDGNKWHIDKNGNASFHNLTATSGTIGPFAVTEEALTYKNSPSFTLSNGGLDLDGKFKVARNGDTTVKGNLTVDGDLIVSGEASLHLNGAGTVGNGGWLSPTGGSGGFYAFGNTEAHIGPWTISEKAIETEFSSLGAEGTLKLQNSSSNGMEIFKDYAHLHYGLNSIYADAASCKLTYGGLTNSATFVYVDSKQVQLHAGGNTFWIDSTGFHMTGAVNIEGWSGKVVFVDESFLEFKNGILVGGTTKDLVSMNGG